MKTIVADSSTNLLKQLEMVTTMDYCSNDGEDTLTQWAELPRRRRQPTCPDGELCVCIDVDGSCDDVMTIGAMKTMEMVDMMTMTTMMAMTTTRDMTTTVTDQHLTGQSIVLTC